MTWCFTIWKYNHYIWEISAGKILIHTLQNKNPSDSDSPNSTIANLPNAIKLSFGQSFHLLLLKSEKSNIVTDFEVITLIFLIYMISWLIFIFWQYIWMTNKVHYCRAFNIVQVYQYFTIYRRYFFLIKFWTIFMDILYNTL